MNPTPEHIKQSRQAAGLTQQKAAALIHVSLKTWQRYEDGSRKMHKAFWELFTLKKG